ncbi:MAG: putative MATE family efflux protein [Saprospiraceae bacterium]|jgi:putative MATE family efflux protein
MRKLLALIFTAIKGSEEDLTKISINRAIILLAVPMILEMVMESLFAVVDIYFVGKISEEAIGVVGLTESVLMIVYSLAIGMMTAAMAMVSRRIGEKNPEGASVVAVQAIILAIAISIIFGICGVVFARDILELMGGSEKLITEGLGFTQIMFATNIFIMLIFLLNGVFRGAGNAVIAMRVLWLSNGLNIILDPLFIFGIGPFPELGVQGAAVATSIGRGVGVLVQLYILFNGKAIVKVAKRHLMIAFDIILNIIKVASGSTFQFLIASASWLFIMRIISVNFSEEVLAGYIISIRVIIFTILPSWGLANAAATLVGQNLGAQQPERAEKSVWTSAFYNMLFMLFISIIFFTFARPIISIFSDNPNVIEAGKTSLRIICAGYVFFAYGMVLSQAFNGAGDTYTPTVLNIIAFWLIQIPLAYTLVQLDFGTKGVYWSIAISESILAILSIYVFRKGKWKAVKI